MEIVATREEMRKLRHELAVAHHDKHFERPLVGLTPTMGALHAGHRALIERMTAECDVGIVSVFVNPKQFGPDDDLDRYPRNFDADCALCQTAGAHLIYAPAVEEMYPAGYQTVVSVGELTHRWCGASRPGHFDGVTTVVAKLFAACLPDRAYFGEKDYQQLRVVQRMTRDLELPVEIVACPTLRETDGLARSSRNQYLTPPEREAAPRLFETLQHMARIFAAGVHDVDSLITEGQRMLNPHSKGSKLELEYLAVVDPRTLEPRTKAQVGDRILVAAHLGSARLIDNVLLTGEEQVP